ncbi:MAG: nuclear transport factor 2 family protein [Actinomycetota bacterium]|nr:nuclear transport factor 2 family protein [Actinomycetota bacterium]
MPLPEQVRAAVESFAELLGVGDRDQWVELFAADATLTDPVPSKPHIGREAIGLFWTGLTGMADHVTLRQHHLHVCGNEAALVYTLTLGIEGGGGTAFDGVETFTVDDDGLITSARAYWDPAELREVAQDD